MTYDQLKEGLRDVGFTTPTPFSDDAETVSHDDLRENARSLYNANARLFVPCGNTGEYYALTNRERTSVVKATVDATGPEATVVGGLGGSTKTARRLAKEYESVGADAVMVMHPDHTYSTESGLIDYYRKIAETTPLGVVIYKRGPEITQNVLSDVTAIDNVVGVKYAVNDVEGFSSAVRETEGDVVWITGSAERFAPSYAMEGAEGFTTGIGNFVPEQVLELHAALTEENWERALEIRDAVRPFERLRDETDDDPVFSSAKNVPAVKYGMELRGFNGGPVREPLRGLSAEDKGRAEEYFDRIVDVSLNYTS